MYRNLIAELARKGIRRKQLAEALGITSSTLYYRLQGHTGRDFTEPEKFYVCNMLGMEPTEEAYAYLFARYMG